MNWREHIVSDPQVLRGKPCLAGTRVPVALILGYLAEGRDAAAICREFPELRPEQRIGFHYVGKVLETGKEIDNSRIKIIPNPLRLSLNEGKLIRGLTEGMIGMRLGGRRLIEIPPAMGYGDAGVPPEIPPKARLLFDIELVEIRDVSTTEALAGLEDK